MDVQDVCYIAISTPVGFSRLYSWKILGQWEECQYGDDNDEDHDGDDFDDGDDDEDNDAGDGDGVHLKPLRVRTLSPGRSNTGQATH